eukprot:TRINITY_DN36622_c0_g1_i1.p1 TRINITY_DN36622_c0_g1~~TRINITY_DN36622_c0_g1_i1.p1  ORF type:complete len:404 (+),score=98.13 TRINITY_DN36622_c0_g1_i1:67-1212(+)
MMYNYAHAAFTANAQAAAAVAAANTVEPEQQKPQDDGLPVVCGPRMGLEQKLATNIEEDYYFRETLCKMTKFEELCEEAKQENCKHVHAWGGMRGEYRRADNIVLGGKTMENNVHVNRSPARLWCILYRMFALRLSEPQLKYLLDNNSKIQHRSLGVLYVRFTQPHEDQLNWVKHLFRDSEDVVQVCPAGQRTGTSTTISNFTKNVFLEMKYLGTQFPRIPVKYLKAIKECIDDVEGEQSGNTRDRDRKVESSKKIEEKDKDKERLKEKRSGEDPPRRKRRGRLGLEDFPSRTVRTEERERLDERSADRKRQLDRLTSKTSYQSRREADSDVNSRSPTPPPREQTTESAPATGYEAVKRAALKKTENKAATAALAKLSKLL